MGNCIKGEQNVKVYKKEDTNPKEKQPNIRDSSRHNTATSLEDFIKSTYAQKLQGRMI